VLRGGCSWAASADADQGSERLGPRQARNFARSNLPIEMRLWSHLWKAE
jgi:hypothetical protein